MRLLLLLGLLLLPQDLGGKVEWYRDLDKGRLRARLEQKSILYYFVDSACVVCKGLNDDALSSDPVVQASRKVIPILVDCTKVTDHKELKEKYAVTGFPTLMLATPEGESIGEIASKDGAVIASTLGDAAKKFPGVACLWAVSFEAAAAQAKADKKPLAIYVHDSKVDLLKLTPKLTKDLGPRVEKCAWMELEATNDDKDATKTKYGYTSLPCVVVLDAKDLKKAPLGTIEILDGDKPETVNKYLDKALAKFKK